MSKRSPGSKLGMKIAKERYRAERQRAREKKQRRRLYEEGWSCSSCGKMDYPEVAGHQVEGERFCDECHSAA